MRFNTSNLISAIKSSEYGTGTLSTTLSIHPNILQKIIATGECEDTLFEKIERVLGKTLSEIETVAEVPVETIPIPDITKSLIVEEEQPISGEDVDTASPTQSEDTQPLAHDETIAQDDGEDARDWLSGTNTEEIELTRVMDLAIAASVNKLKQLVSKGEVNPEQLLQVEQEREYPRVSLTRWLLKSIGTSDGDSSPNITS